ncbi:MAG: mandelate racemase/muconate lactonizing enzyme family protein [Planctomycetes bacterium]|nr:mandelate racemase/muconate lactonizing enzyme family protein [Planctomycetota bacterium]
MLDRRRFLKGAGGATAGLAFLNNWTWSQESYGLTAKIIDVQVSGGVTIVAENGTKGRFTGSGKQDLETLKSHLLRIRELLIGKNPLDRKLSGEMLWEAIYPGKAKLYAEGRDPLTGKLIVNKPRDDRHTKTGRVFMAFSTVDIALWDLRGKLLNQPAYRIMGDARRTKVPVYWRPGEADKGLDDARRRAREAYDRGYVYQKWYFTKSAKDGDSGLKENIELVRVLREELPDAHLMFDNHSIRYYADVDYSVRLCKAVAPYKPFWIEEPICPEHLDGYARIKDESGVTIAGGEHWYTRWQVKPFLERKCVDYVQSDPIWCGGISEWLKICQLVRQYSGVKVVPHITSPWLAAPHCVASQPEELCPLLEFNYEGGRKALDGSMSRSSDGDVVMTMSDAPGIS